MAARGGREHAVVLAVGAAAVGLLLLSVGQPWVQASILTPGMPRQEVAVSGADAAGELRALALVALAALAATLATSGRWRQLVATVLTVVGVGAWLAALRAGAHLNQTLRSAAADTPAGADAEAVDQAVRAADGTGWAWVAGVAALLLVATGMAAVARGARWPGMSRRYERSSAQPPSTQPPSAQPTGTAEPAGTAEPGERTDAQDLWRALDEGHDPTR
ncbi:hypothetical protein BH20ACT6_BH20ACT6_02220 [soil metagenome]